MLPMCLVFLSTCTFKEHRLGGKLRNLSDSLRNGTVRCSAEGHGGSVYH